MKRHPLDLTLLGWVVVSASAILVAIGLITIYGIEIPSNRTPRETIKQTGCAVLGFPLAVVILKLGYARLARWAYFIMLIAIVGLIPLAVARFTGTTFGGWVPSIRSSYRWIQLPGFQFQPSEFVKFAYILSLAHYLRFRTSYRRLRGLIVPFLLSLIPLFLILIEPDLGTSLLIMPVLFVMLFAAGARVKHLLLIVAMGVACLPLLWTQMEGYQKLRVMALVMQSDRVREAIKENPDRYADITGVTKQEALTWERSSGMQLVRSKQALGSGGVLGRGLGKGTYVEYSFLPDRHNDFIFAIVGHQFGFIGCTLVLLGFAAIALAGSAVAAATDDPEARLIAIGVVTLISAQAVINVGMTLGLMPVTGMTLPFVSSGRTSLLINIMAVALLVSVSRHRPFMVAPKPFEFSRESRPLSQG